MITIDEGRIRQHLGEMVRSTVGKTLNAMLDAETGEVELKVPKLRRAAFETAIITRHRRRESSAEEALMEMYLAGVSVRRLPITVAIPGGGVTDSEMTHAR